MSYIRTPPEPSLLVFTPYDLLQRYPNLPIWAVHAFQSLKQPQQLWTPEARALLNMTHVPPVGMPLEKLLLHLGTPSENLKESFATEEEWKYAKREIDLWRLSRDLNGAKKEGWNQDKGKKKRGSYNC